MSSTISVFTRSNYSEIASKDFNQNYLFFELAMEYDLDREDSMHVDVEDLRDVLKKVKVDKCSAEEQNFIQEVLGKTQECEEELILSVYR